MADYYDKSEPYIFEEFQTEISNAIKPRYILDVGCGNCKLVNYLAQNNKCNVFGIDIDSSLFPSPIKNTTYIKGTADKLDTIMLPLITPYKYDVCVSLYTLHELKNPQIVLNQIYKVLSNQGVLILIDFPRYSLAEDIYSEYQERYYHPYQMRRFIAKAGFEHMRVEMLLGDNLTKVVAMKRR